jgi:hypothetical protein
MRTCIVPQSGVRACQQPALDHGPDGNHPATGAMDDDEIDAREAARIRRRDREAAAEARELMRPGMGKVFKQIQDRQRRAAEAQEPPPKRRRRRGQASV